MDEIITSWTSCTELIVLSDSKINNIFTYYLFIEPLQFPDFTNNISYTHTQINSN